MDLSTLEQASYVAMIGGSTLLLISFVAFVFPKQFFSAAYLIFYWLGVLGRAIFFPVASLFKKKEPIESFKL